jgi:hypothetical protein
MYNKAMPWKALYLQFSRLYKTCFCFLFIRHKLSNWNAIDGVEKLCVTAVDLVFNFTLI